MVDRGVTLCIYHHQLSRSSDAFPAGPLPQSSIPLDQYRLRLHCDRIPDRVHHWANCVRAPDGQAGNPSRTYVCRRLVLTDLGPDDTRKWNL